MAALKTDSSMEASPINVKVRFMGDLRAVVGQPDLTMSLPAESSVGDVLTFLSHKFGGAFTHWLFNSSGRLQHYVLIFVNSQNIKDIGGLAARLEEGEMEIILLPMFEGG